jgi:hypothetical protein
MSKESPEEKPKETHETRTVIIGDYLGDGVYAKYDGRDICISTIRGSAHEQIEHYIHFDDEVIHGFLRFLKYKLEVDLKKLVERI